VLVHVGPQHFARTDSWCPKRFELVNSVGLRDVANSLTADLICCWIGEIWRHIPFNLTITDIDDTTLNVIYNIADLLNKIGFVLSCWSCAKSDDDKDGPWREMPRKGFAGDALSDYSGVVVPY